MIRRAFTVILAILGVYCGGYWWFRTAHTAQYISAVGPSIELPGVGPLSALTWAFRPLASIDQHFRPSATFFLVDADGRTLLGDHPYPFARVWEETSQ